MIKKGKKDKKRSHKEIDTFNLTRGIINTLMSSPETIIEKSLINHFNDIIIKSNPNSNYYRKLEISGKSYIMSTKIKDVEIRRNLYYYCVNHRTTKT